MLEARFLATGEDYYLFPQGQMSGCRLGRGVVDVARHSAAGPVSETAMRKWFLECEEKAKVPHLEGRGAYGLRRPAVDTGKVMGISREGLQQLGGWSDSQVPDQIYADSMREEYAAEAATVRAKIRGEEVGRSCALSARVDPSCETATQKGRRIGLRPSIED